MEDDEEMMPMFMPLLSGSQEFLTRNRIIYFSGEFTEESARDVIGRLLALNATGIGEDITLIIDSCGGSVAAFLAIYDTITKLIYCDVATLCLGQAMSAGQLLLMSGTKGKRFITENSRVMMHQISSGTVGKISDMEKHVGFVKDLSRIVQKLILSHTKIRKGELERLMQMDSFMTAEQALNLGIVDFIVRSPKDFYSRISKQQDRIDKIAKSVARTSKIKEV